MTEDTTMKTTDRTLRLAANDMKAHDQAINELHKAYGDDADSRQDYRKIEALRTACIKTLVEVESSSLVGLLAKAEAVRQLDLRADHEGQQDVALSLADDVIRLGPVVGIHDEAEAIID